MPRFPLPAGVALSDARRRLSPADSVRSLLGDGVATASSIRAQATATASATPHTKGPWTQIIASTTSDAHLIELALTATTFVTAADTSLLLDIGIGGAGSEVVIVPNLALGWRFTLNSPLYTIPVYVPPASRVAIRCQSTVVSAAALVELQLWGSVLNRPSPAAVLAMGDNTATSRGVSLAVPASNNTKGAWSQIIAATAEPFDALMIGVQGAADTDQKVGGAIVDIGIGGSGSESVLVPDFPLWVTGNEHIDNIAMPLFPCRLPTGTRLSARYAAANTGTSLDVILYGIRS